MGRYRHLQGAIPPNCPWIRHCLKVWSFDQMTELGELKESLRTLANSKTKVFVFSATPQPTMQSKKLVLVSVFHF